MSDFDRCQRCKEWHWTYQPCAPLWEVNIADYDGEDDWRGIYARDEEAAAERAAELFDCDGDYTVVGGSNIKVRVRKGEDSPIKTFEVSGETVLRYHASEVD